jgi:hypothetical protein
LSRLLKEGQLQFFGCFCFERLGYFCDEQDDTAARITAAKIIKNPLLIKTIRLELSTV